MEHTRANTKSPALIIAVVLLIALLGYKLSLAVREGLAWLYAQPANQLMNQWQFSADAQEAAATADGTNPAPFVPDPAEWQAVLQNSEQALALAPGNPVYYANLGRLYSFRLDDKALDITDIEMLGTNTLYYFHQAAQLRPTWTYYWWDVALTEYRLFHYHTDTYQNALQNVARFGPWFDDAQDFVADLALETWASLDPVTQQSAMNSIERALQHQPKRITELVEQHNAWSILCNPVTPGDVHPNIDNLCAAY